MSLINLKFSPEMEEAVITGRKCCTTRREQKGAIGDVFIVRDRMYRIVQIDECDLNFASIMANAEGFKSDIEFEDVMMDIYPDMSLDSQVYIHYFAYLTDICPDFNQGHNCCIPSVCPASEVCNHGG